MMEMSKPINGLDLDSWITCIFYFKGKCTQSKVKM